MVRGEGTSSRKRPARRAASRRRSGGGGRWPWVVALVLVLACLFALPAYRWWWRRAEGSPLGRGLSLLDRQGCVTCHRTQDGCWRWRADGTRPASMEAIRDAVLNGREASQGFPGAMPAYGQRLRARQFREVAAAAGAVTGLLGVPEDQELAAGHDIVIQMGCGSCHGPLGAGGAANPGAVTEQVPGWYGRSFAAVAATDGGLENLIRHGSRPAGLPLPGAPPPLLSMPAFGTHLDSVELDLLVRYLQWLHANPPR